MIMETDMIELAQGNILKADAEALVNTVNSVGVMGKGIALQFKKAFPENYRAYEKACRNQEVEPGRMLIFETGTMFNPRYIINFPNKRHWREKSRYEYIDAGLQALVEEVQRLGITSIAIPPLGCGLGGLDWKRVRPMIENAFSMLSNVQVYLFEPKGAPQAEEMPVGSAKPYLTVARALLIKLMQQYARHAYRLTLLETQKLAYFMQESGQDLQLRYVKHHYGPYAHNLNKLLEVLEGHYISGYGDSQQPDVEVSLLPGAVENADEFLDQHTDERQRLEEVEGLIDGFETPYGMELLSSVHWLSVHDKKATDPDSAIAGMRQWNDRKRSLFRPDHIRVAWKRLHDKDCLAMKDSPTL